MKTKAVRLYGKEDLRLEEFELPEIRDNEILAKVICDSLCMSSYKAAHQGSEHSRIPDNVAENPIIIGHEFMGEIIQVGNKWKDRFAPGEKFSIQPAVNYENGPVGVLSAPGYSYPQIGGDSTFVIIPEEIMQNNCLLKYSGEGYYPGALAEPFSCVVGAMHANYHTDPGSYKHNMEIVQGGNMAILAGVGPMGLAAINYAIHREDRQPGLLVVTDIDQQRLDRAMSLYSPEEALKNGIVLKYLNTSLMNQPVKQLRNMTQGEGFHDVFVFAPIPALIEQADAILSRDGCLNFFAGPSDPEFKANFNFFNVHYQSTHLVGTSGGNNEDMLESLRCFNKGLDPAGLITHIGGINAVIDATLNLPGIPGGKKLIYLHIDMPLTALTEFGEKGKTIPLFAKLNDICAKHNGLWSTEAEKYLLKQLGSPVGYYQKQ
jgi:L-sorbose 1-phosphate reductase